MKIVLRLMMISMLFGIYANVSYAQGEAAVPFLLLAPDSRAGGIGAISYTHLRAHETVLDLVCRLLLEKKNTIL